MAWKKSLDGGTLFTQFSHFIDIMYWLFGDIQNIQAKFNDFNHNTLTDFEDSGFVSFDFVNGGMTLKIEIRWPSGQKQIIDSLPVNTLHHLVEP